MPYGDEGMNVGNGLLPYPPPPPPSYRIYASVNWVSNGSDNGLSPIRRQAII